MVLHSLKPIDVTVVPSLYLGRDPNLQCAAGASEELTTVRPKDPHSQ